MLLLSPFFVFNQFLYCQSFLWTKARAGNGDKLNERVHMVHCGLILVCASPSQYCKDILRISMQQASYGFFFFFFFLWEQATLVPIDILVGLSQVIVQLNLRKRL
jgi:hypothetical protein